MTIEEAHEILSNGLANALSEHEWCVAFKMAIEALEVLDKIRAEIEQIADEEQQHDVKWAMGLRYAVKIIDKYKAESEGKE